MLIIEKYISCTYLQQAAYRVSLMHIKERTPSNKIEIDLYLYLHKFQNF